MNPAERQGAAFELFEAWRRGEAELAAITGLLRIRPVALGDGTASLSIQAGPPHHNPFGTVAGGVFSALADVAMGVALATRLDGEGTSTLQQQIEHIRPATESSLVAHAEVVHRGRRIANVRCGVVDDRDRLLAQASSVWLISRSPEEPRHGAAGLQDLRA
jgi:uncharacterized protein (TIGR00369 family)